MSVIKQLGIGSVTLENNLILAPMAGVTDLPFRLYARSRAQDFCAWRWSVPRRFFTKIKIQKSF